MDDVGRSGLGRWCQAFSGLRRRIRRRCLPWALVLRLRNCFARLASRTSLVLCASRSRSATMTLINWECRLNTICSFICGLGIRGVESQAHWQAARSQPASPSSLCIGLSERVRAESSPGGYGGEGHQDQGGDDHQRFLAPDVRGGGTDHEDHQTDCGPCGQR